MACKAHRDFYRKTKPHITVPEMYMPAALPLPLSPRIGVLNR